MILSLWNTMYSDSSTRVNNALYRQEVDFPMHEEVVLSSDLETDQPEEQGPEFSEQMDPRALRRRKEEVLYYDQDRMAEEPRRHRKRGRQHHLDADNALPAMPDGPSDEYMDDIHDFEDGYDMPGAFHGDRDLDGQEQRIWDGGKHRQRDHRHNRRMTPLPRRDDPMQMHSQEKRGLTAALSHAQTEARTLQRQMDDMKREIRGAREALAREQAKRQEDRHLLDARGEELRNAHAFLSKADAHSHADIKAMIVALNSEIMQLASYMSDTLHLDQSQLDPSDEDASAAVSQEKHMLGDRMIFLLGTRDNQDLREVALLCSLQAVMVRTCNEMIRRWHRETKIHKICSDLYQDVKDSSRLSLSSNRVCRLCTFSDAPAVAGRWRALTRAETKYRSEEDVEDLCSRLLVTHLWSVSRIAGWMTPDGRSIIEKDFGGRIMEISKLMKQVDRAMNEGITSEDLVTYVVQPDVRFDPAMMVDDNQGSQAEMVTEDDVTVACTTELGLKAYSVDSPSDDVRDFRMTVLMKPKVVLWASMMS
ncbi:hypothetical protein EV421DRAFT_2088130 [Armillaria borealis]|uniref:Uncharacterized protein n=1 Tax=Armillaria borealis TaxID=47425 RepID=A0AA39MHY7_9AGAR|nr:hypothetical protein EV421DRAFT_2088130 [Armillaria borealis]